MRKVLQIWLLAWTVLVGVLADARPAVQGGSPQSLGEMSSRLSRRGSFGRINVQGGRKHIPDGAEVSIERKRPDDVKRKIQQGWSRRSGAALPRSPKSGRAARLMGASGSGERTPNVLASYDISIKSGGKKWQPAANDPVRVTVELDQPVTVKSGSSLGVVHLSDDGAVEELPASRYGFVYDATKTAVTAFWFSAEGFSVYAITEENGTYTPNRRLYDFYSLDFDATSPTYNTYVPRYFTTVEGNKTFRQIVKSGEALSRPEVLPSPLGRTFIGWFLYDEDKANTIEDGVEYDEEGYAKTKFDFTHPIVFADTPDGEGEVHGAREYVLRARFAHEGYVIFHEQPVGNDWPITAVRRAVLEEVVEGGVTSMVGTVRIDDLKVTYDDSVDENNQHEHSSPRMIFRGWSETPVMPGSLTDTNGNAVVILESPYVRRRAIDAEALPRDLYPVFVNINWLTFYAAETGSGATYIPPRYYYQDEGTNKFAVSSRTGYVFNGWWTGTNSAAVQVTDASGTLRTNFTAAELSAITAWGGKIEGGNLKLTDNVTLYAHWNMGTADYTVVFWLQKATDAANLPNDQKEYDFYDSVQRQAATESTVSVTTADQRKSIANFTYSRCDAATTVKGNGSTVLNVYYDRNVHTLTFRTGNSSSSNVKTVTALAGSIIKNEFPVVRESDGYVYEGKTWTGNRVYTQRLAALEIMPDADITFTLSTATGVGGTLQYYVEVDAEDGYEVTRDNKYYKLYKTITHDFNFLTYNEDFHPIAGYTNDMNNASITFEYANQMYRYPRSGNLTAGNVVNFYYDRLEYKLEFVDSYNNNVLGESDVKFSQKIGKHVPDNPASTRPGYYFDGWFADAACSVKVFFEKNAAYDSYTDGKVLYETMPTANLRIFAKWETEWYLIKIDPNYGSLPAGQSTWFWEAYNGDPIEEYSATTRSFVESLNGTWFYAIKNRDYYGYTDEYVRGEAAERGAYYTQDQSDPAIVQDGKRYAPAVNVYRYSGWYEVDPVTGEETLYAFGQPVQHNTTLRLHWKHIGMYHLYYDPGEGSMSLGDENEVTFEILDAGVYADSSDVLVTRTAVPPKGYTFAGWKIRYGDGEVLHPGQEFFFNSAYTVTALDDKGNPIKRLVLDAVYEKVSTVSLTTDANGGTVDDEVANTLTLAYDNPPSLITNTTDTARSVSGMRNNAFGTLSDGTGYTCVVKDEHGNDVELAFRGWNTKADGTGTTFAGGSFVGLDTLGTPDENGANTLYAMWGVDVRFDKNNSNADWLADQWGPEYVFDDDLDHEAFVQTNVVLHGYATYPGVALVSYESDEMFRCWSTNQYTDVLSDMTPEQLAEVAYDFSQPVEGPLTLYAIWSKFIHVPFHVVDASTAERQLMDYNRTWMPGNPEFKVGNVTDIDLSDTPVDSTGYPYVTPPANYLFAFACVSHDVDDISESKKITRVFFNPDPSVRAVSVEYANGDVEVLGSGKRIYLVYFTDPTDGAIGYREMQNDGALATVSTNAASAAPGTVEFSTNAYDVATLLSTPMDYPVNKSDYRYYAYAIGETNATSGAQLRYLTAAKTSNASRPDLWVRNTWRGYEYCTSDNPEDANAVWHLYGYGAQLYVVYFQSQPTIINLFEQTVGTEADMAEKFEYVIAVTQVVSEVTVTETRSISGGTQRTSTNRTYPYGPYTRPSNGYSYCFSSDWTAWSASAPTVTADSHTGSCYTNELANGGTESVTLFSGQTGTEYGEASQDWTYSSSSRTYTITETRDIVTHVNTHTVVITQVPKAGFTTDWSDSENRSGTYVYTSEAAAEATTRSVTYTNTRDGLPVELHVAVTQDGGFVNGDADYRSTTTNDYTVTVPISTDGTSSVTADDLASKTNTLFKTEMDEDSRFMGVYYGKTNENGVVTFEGEVTSVGFVKPENSEYYTLCLNNDPTIPFDDYQIYYVYCEMPRIYYVATGANGALTKHDPVTFEGAPVSMGNAGEAAATQGTLLEVGMDAASTVAVGAGSDHFAVPMVMDGVEPGSLNQVAFGFGAADATSTNGMDGVTHASSIQLKVVDMMLKWSADGTTWGAFTGKPAVYVIYKEAGHDLTINATSLASADDKANDTFTVTISSENLFDGVPYVITGYTDSNGDPIETVTPVNGVITLTLKSGDSVTIESLHDDGTHPYVVKQTPQADDYAQEITVDGHTPLSTGDDGSVSIFLERDRVVDFTNTKSYTVSFVDDEGNPIMVDDGNGNEVPLEKKVPFGTKPDEITDGVDTPTKPMDETSIYRFDDWGPEMEPVGSNTTYTASYNEIKIPSATQRTEDATNLVVTLTAEEAQAREEALTNALAAVGIDIFAEDYSEEIATELLNAIDPNGLRHWENLVTGTDTNAPPLSTSSTTNSTQLTVQLTEEPNSDNMVNLGYTMLRDLRKYDETNKTWNRIAGPVSVNAPAFNIDLVNEQGKSIGATGLYRVFTLLVPDTYQAITNEIPSANIIGVLEVVSPLTNTVVAVPWKELASDPALAADITVSNYVSTVNLSDGDCVYALPDDTGSKRSGTDASGIYEMWTLEGGYWDAYTTVSFAKGGDSGYSEITPADPSDKRRFPRTKAVWVQRKRPLDDNGNPVPFFLIGQYEFKGVEIAIKGGSAADPGYTLISVPSYKDFSINSLDWSGYKPSDGDFIRVVNGTQSFLLKWSDGKWCTEEINYRRGRPSGVKYERYETPLKAGTGFWFCGHGADFTITWTPEEEVR